MSRRDSALPARPVTAADLAALTERVRRRVIRWFRLARLLDAAAAADMLGWENSGFSIDASVRITLLDRDVPSYFQSLKHLLRYCARPPFALERLSVSRDADGRIARTLAGCGQTACRTSGKRCRECNSREKRSFSSGQRPRMDFGHGLLAGCGQTACCTSWMRCRERSSRENRRFSSGQRPWMDFGHGLLGPASPFQR
ncbi:MAG: hypothetical protein EBR86_12885 [Planctomycetia bacterium]|nr:hypothetical protein [Planctomycetia bacterium]